MSAARVAQEICVKRRRLVIISAKPLFLANEVLLNREKERLQRLKAVAGNRTRQFASRKEREEKVGGWFSRQLKMLLASIREVAEGLISSLSKDSMMAFAFAGVSKTSVGVPVR